MATRAPLRHGYGVAIRRADGSEFVAYAGHGLLPAIFAQRRFAVAHRRGLIRHGFAPRVVRVVRVQYVEPVVVPSRRGMRRG